MDLSKIEELSKTLDELSQTIEYIKAAIDEYKEKNNTNLDNTDDNDILTDNNTLIISETKGKVFLPYKIEDLQNTLKENECYKDISDLIEKEYVIPTSQYKMPIISRYKETFKLMREREKVSVIKSVKLAIELSMNSLLNPAIIAACKGLDELDIYLDCLENNELDKFKIFEVQYEIAPAIVK